MRLACEGIPTPRHSSYLALETDKQEQCYPAAHPLPEQCGQHAASFPSPRGRRAAQCWNVLTSVLREMAELTGRTVLPSRNLRHCCRAAMTKAHTLGFIFGTNYAFPLSLLQQPYLLFLTVWSNLKKKHLKKLLLFPSCCLNHFFVVGCSHGHLKKFLLCQLHYWGGQTGKREISSNPDNME